MRLLFVYILFQTLCCSNASGQDNPFMNDIHGRPLYLTINYKAEGSPYLSENYQRCTVVDNAGKVYRNLLIKVDLVDNRVLYLDAEGKEMVTSVPVSRLVFDNYLNEHGESEPGDFIASPVPFNNAGAGLYQVLDSGKICLLKKIAISYRDEKRYNEAGYTRIFRQSEDLYAMTATGSMVKLARNTDSMLGLFQDHRNAVNEFVSTRHLKCSSAKDLQQIFRYYNSLH